MGLKDNIKMIENGDPRIALFQAKIDKYFIDKNKSRPHRPGMFHTSSIINDKFCLRESYWDAVKPIPESPISPNVLRIFATGNDAHEKYQTMFTEMGIAKYVEQPFYSKFLDLTGTPDVIIDFYGMQTGVEIKTMNTMAFYHMTKPHASAFKQAQVYMYLLGLPQFIIFCENKNDQNIKLFLIKFDLEVAMTYIKRIRTLRIYLDTKLTPALNICMCSKKGDRRSCRYNKRCFPC